VMWRQDEQADDKNGLNAKVDAGWERAVGERKLAHGDKKDDHKVQTERDPAVFVGGTEIVVKAWDSDRDGGYYAA